MPHSSAVCDFGWKAPQFNLPSTKGSDVSLKSAKGENGTLIMFICNHCPYVVSVLDDIIDEDGNPVDAARHPLQILKVFIPFKVSKYDMLRKIIQLSWKKTKIEYNNNWVAWETLQKGV